MIEMSPPPRLKLRPQFKEQWIKALLSGEYRQTRGYLHVLRDVRDSRVSEGWCCLGVACDVLDKNGVPMERSTVGQAMEAEVLEAFDGAVGTPSDALSEQMFERAEWMKSAERSTAVGSIIDALASANDMGSTFSEIAEWIEEHL